MLIIRNAILGEYFICFDSSIRLLLVAFTINASAAVAAVFGSVSASISFKSICVMGSSSITHG